MISAMLLKIFKGWTKKYEEDGETMGCGTVILALIGMLVAIVLIFCISWAIGMWLWNTCLVAAVPVLTKVTFWQFAGIEIVCGMLFKGGSTTTADKE